MLAQGVPVREVARQLGVTKQTVHVWQRDSAEEIEAKAEQTARTIAEQLQQLNGQAVETLRELMTGSDNDQVRLQAARTVLSRAGYPEGKDVDVHMTGLERMSDEEIAEEIERVYRLKDSLKGAGDG